MDDDEPRPDDQDGVDDDKEEQLQVATSLLGSLGYSGLAHGRLKRISIILTRTKHWERGENWELVGEIMLVSLTESTVIKGTQRY